MDQPSAPLRTSTVSDDVAEVRVFLTVDGDANVPPYVDDPAETFRQELLRARYRLVDRYDQADLILRVGAPATIAPPTYTEPGDGLTLTAVDKAQRTIEIIQGRYASDTDVSDSREITMMVARLTTSPRLAAYAASLKQMRAEQLGRAQGK